MKETALGGRSEILVPHFETAARLRSAPAPADAEQTESASHVRLSPDVLGYWHGCGRDLSTMGLDKSRPSCKTFCDQRELAEALRC